MPPLEQEIALSRLFQVGLYDPSGQLWIEHPKFNRPVEITAMYTDQELVQASGDPMRLTLLWFNDTERWWEILQTVVNTASRTPTAEVTHFSTFGVGTWLGPGAYRYADPDSHTVDSSYSHPDSNAHTCAHCHPYPATTYPDAYAYTHSDGYANTNTHAISRKRS